MSLIFLWVIRDHTETESAAVIAATLGAVCFEKHITLDRNMLGPDHKASMEPDAFSSYVSRIQEVKKTGQLPSNLSTQDISMFMGDGQKKPTDIERETAKLVRKSLVANKALEKGHVITPNDISIKRPGNGLPPKEWDRIVGKVLKRNLVAESVLSWADFE